jgi:hypothetical protein
LENLTAEQKEEYIKEMQEKSEIVLKIEGLNQEVKLTNEFVKFER